MTVPLSGGNSATLLAALDSAMGGELAVLVDDLECCGDGWERQVGLFGEVRDVMNPPLRVSRHVGEEDDSVVGQFVQPYHFS